MRDRSARWFSIRSSRRRESILIFLEAVQQVAEAAIELRLGVESAAPQHRTGLLAALVEIDGAAEQHQGDTEGEQREIGDVERRKRQHDRRGGAMDDHGPGLGQNLHVTGQHRVDPAPADALERRQIRPRDPFSEAHPQSIDVGLDDPDRRVQRIALGEQEAGATQDEPSQELELDPLGLGVVADGVDHRHDRAHRDAGGDGARHQPQARLPGLVQQDPDEPHRRDRRSRPPLRPAPPVTPLSACRRTSGPSRAAPSALAARTGRPGR